MNKYFKIIILAISFLWFLQEGIAQCFTNVPLTAAFADPETSESPYANKVLWLTWGATNANQAQYPYGREKQNINIGSKSYATIDLGGDKFLCMEAEITNIENIAGVGNNGLESYIPGTYVGNGTTSGDFLDILYNIGGGRTPTNQVQNEMVSGIINKGSGSGAKITIKGKASINGNPIRLAGLVVADAESLDATGNEFIYATAKGSWNVVEVQKNLENSGAYPIRKEINANDTETIKFIQGNNQKTGAIAFLSFNEGAYALSDYAVEFTATLRGAGKTALAIGLLTPNADLGDAPESYGSPIHLLQNLTFTPDNITPVAHDASDADKDAATVNINTASYTSGALVPTEGSYLGSTPPDADNGPMYSKDALGDDLSPIGNPLLNEEDAWPEQYRRFSYKANYMPGNKITATIPYKGGEVGDKISGWIDFNLNGKFDESERITTNITNAGDGSVVLEWEVPETRVPYSTYVRLRYFRKNEGAGESPTDNVNFGEVEDHRIYILTPGLTNPMLPGKSKKEDN